MDEGGEQGWNENEYQYFFLPTRAGSQVHELWGLNF